jgi:hypothetical protein
LIIHDFLEENILLLTASPVVEHFRIVTRRETESDGYLRVRAILIGKGLLEVSIYCQMAENAVRLVDYRFHWQDREGKLIKRWDNARHHPELTTFPYHIHVGSDSVVKESTNVDLLEVLQELELEAGEV